MRVWIDLANSPHVALFEPIVKTLEQRGDDVAITVRDHAQTMELALRAWPDAVVVGGASPPGVLAKGIAIGRRALALAGFARRFRPDVCLSHGSYSQTLAASIMRRPSITMMDYEAQPANHLSFRLSSRVIVPESFPNDYLRRFGASREKTRRYPGFKESLYLTGFVPDEELRTALGVGAADVLAVMRPPPDGALYHRGANERFDELVETACSERDVVPLVLPRSEAQRVRYAVPGVRVLSAAVDGRSLVACADVVIGAGGTMNREAALLGTPTYTLFSGKLAAVDALLIEEGRMHDLRAPGSRPTFVRRDRTVVRPPQDGAGPIIEVLLAAICELV